MVLLIFFRKSQRELEIDIDFQVNSPADYTILVKNIPNKL